ncbi:F-box/WD repeat-containing protein 1A-like isoform X4 [Alligator sinensis]|nr:F-box/WD repeat-containing protein 1A-like isoform X4 [Alligator sinensis]XP_025057019.1 F-box/WD repeat-containing protein 1A-like isoform X4 [Alligator sinensis]
MPRSLWLGCSSLADSMPSLRCLYNPGTGALTAFQNSSEREDCSNDEPPRKIIPEKNSLRQTYNSCARLCLNQETVCLGSTAMKTENCVAKLGAICAGSTFEPALSCCFFSLGVTGAKLDVVAPFYFPLVNGPVARLALHAGDSLSSLWAYSLPSFSLQSSWVRGAVHGNYISQH